MTNITEDHIEAFEAVRDPDYSNIGLVSCFLNGTPTVAIAVFNDDGETIKITPMFVAVTPDMVLTDHDGVSANGGLH